jgi:DNA repair exonuclease SbcCD nuclease subunit
LDSAVRILLLADTHLGFDAPRRPRVTRRRRGPDFFDGYRRALAPARAGEVDLVVHGGDLLYRARVPADLVERAVAPLRRVAARGVPVFLVPGNHERSRIPFPLLAQHPRLHVFHGPSTFVATVRGVRVAVSGFPFAREVRGAAFARLLAATGWRDHAADVRLLCLHQAVEGARVGVQDFVFRDGRDVVAGRDLPRGFAAVLCGHIHRAQTLTRDLAGRPLAAPVLYPGSIERTSFAERDEPKGYVRLEVVPGADGGRLARWEFVPLPTRPMVVLDVPSRALLARRLAALDPHAVVRVVCPDPPPSAAQLRALAPPTMNVDVRPAGERRRS